MFSTFIYTQNACTKCKKKNEDSDSFSRLITFTRIFNFHALNEQIQNSNFFFVTQKVNSAIEFQKKKKKNSNNDSAL